MAKYCPWPAASKSFIPAGHCAGQVALLWRPGRMLLAGDVGTNLMGLGDPVGFENLEEGRASQRKIASLSFDGAGFGHGEPIVRDASTRFRDKWGTEEARKKSAA
jgi:glyoxylase-like metal-dependent hydrolase (beta-lactamase superfamily II)